MKTRTIALQACAFLAPAIAAPVAAQGVNVGGDGLTVINVEVDYMVAGDHDHLLGPTEVAALQQMFACHGIFLNIVIDDAIPEQTFMQCDDVDEEDFFGCEGSLSFEDLAEQYFDSGPIGWHYCIMGHQYNKKGSTDSSGLGQIEGRFFIVTLGNWDDEGTPFERAATFAHELGHNLSLEHFSAESQIAPGPAAANYPSVMSYQYQLRGVRSQLECLGVAPDLNHFKDLDYSNGRVPTLFESLLDESVGIGMNPVDFDCDGGLTPGLVTRNIDQDGNWCDEGFGVSVLGDTSDWANLEDWTWVPWDSGVPMSELREVSCLRYSEFEAQKKGSAEGIFDLNDPSMCGSTLPTLIVEPCEPALMVWADPLASGFQTGSGESPWADPAVAQALSPEGSIIYLQPGTFGSGVGNSLLLDKRMFWAGPGGAVIHP